MQNLRSQLLRTGLASKEQVQRAETDARQEATRVKFRDTGELRRFLEAYPVFREGLRGFPPDARVFVEPDVEYKLLCLKCPERSCRLETCYGSLYIGDILVVRIDPVGGRVVRTPLNLKTTIDESGK